MDRQTDLRLTGADAPGETWLKRIARVLLPVVSWSLLIQPAAFAAPTPSLLSQTPMFLDLAVQSNVVFLMDDSSSMNDTRLPLAAGLTPPATSGGCPAGQVRVAGGLCVERDSWLHRSSALNPLYYNPAITYRAWNDNGRLGLVGSFTPASTGMTGFANWFREGLVAHDMRYNGPNYGYGVGNDFSRRLTTTGANPPVGSGYPAASPANDGFQGEIWSGRNQDIFSSPFRFVTTLTPSCPAPFAATSNPAPFAVRSSSDRPFAVRTTSARPSQAQTFSVRTDTPPNWLAPVTAAPSSTNRTITDRTISDRTITDRTITDRTLTNRALTARSFTPRGSSDRVISNRPTEYRQETGVCGQWTAWTTVGPPATSFCVDPSGEGNSRVALTETQFQPCPAGTSDFGASQCISNCPAGTTASGNQCLSDCGAGFSVYSATQCASNCPGGSSVYSDTTQCIADCPAGTTTSGATQCISNCPGGAVAYGANQCASTCPAGSVVHTNTAQCITTCPGGTVAFGATQCITPCPAGTTAYGTNQCISNCAAGTTEGTLAGVPVCFSCPAGSTFSGGQCLSCPSGTLATNPGTGLLECRVCPVGSTFTGGVCRTDCLAGQTAGTSGGLNVCFNACPGMFPSAGTGGNLGTCFGACPGGSNPVSPLPGNAGFAQCITNCAAGETAGTSGGLQVCFQSCPAGTTLIGALCYANCAAGETASVSGGQQVCLQGCPAGSTASGSNCLSCPAGSSPFGTNQCCTDGTASLGNCPAQVPTGAPWGGACTVADRYYPDLTRPALAHFYAFQPTDLTRAPTLAELSDPANYRQLQVNRDAPAFQAAFQTPYIDNDPTKGRAMRSDCAAITTCTWAEEAQNFANWYTYYRTRLFTAIGVTAESLSKLTSASGLDRLRLSYGSINYFPGGQNPFSANPPLNRLPAQTIDGQSSEGAIVRGVRPFTEVSPPPAPGSNDRRQEVFDWLFSLRALGSTPNREALDSVGRYLARRDDRGPWIEPADPNAWVSTENPLDHVSCRRNFAILVTDGEWTRTPSTTPPQQPLIEQRTSAGLPATFVGSQGYAPWDALSTPGPLHTGVGVAAGRTYQYLPGAEPQFSDVTGSPRNTLSDVALFWWSRDLRPDLPNNLQPIDAPADKRNEAFWQHLTPFIVGYGISASRDNAATRGQIAARQPITWPGVVMENRPGEVGTIVTDQDVFPRPPDAGADRCLHSGANPSGCGRVDDTFRAAMAARADFLAANDVGGLAAQVAAAFDAIGEIEGTGTSLAARSATLQAGDKVYLASFFTNRWTGNLVAHDAVPWFDALRAGLPPPAPVWQASFPAFNARNLLTSTNAFGAGATFAALGTLDPTQQAALGSQAVLDYLRGDQSLETTSGGPFRRRLSLLGDIVNSSPVYSKAPDFGYSAGRQPAAGGGPTYRTYVANNANAVTGRRASLFVGANDGMLHGFDAADGRELFAYVPRAVYPSLAVLSSPGYTHRYYVDGPIVEGDIFRAGSWRTTIVATAGAGAKSIFALDVTRPEAVGVADVLWDLTGDDHPDIGHILSGGVVGSARDGQWYYFVGNGVESQNDKARLLAINMATGAVISLVTDGAGGPDPADANPDNRPNGLGGITPVYDVNRNIVAVYGGDRHGRMWKFDLAAVGPGLAGYVTTRLFTAVDSFGNRQPISAAPRIAPHPLGGRYVVFGTGKFYDRNDKADSSVQAVYALWEKDPSSPVALAKAQLRQLTLTQPAVLPPPGTQFFRTLNGQSAINWQTDLGWYFDLRAGGPGTGERVITTPIENLGFISLVSFEPLAGGDPCRGGGQSFFYRLDIASTFSRGAFDGQPNSNIAVNMDPTFGQFQIVQKKPLEYAGSQPGLGGTDLGGLRTNPPGAGAPVSACPPGVLPHITNRPGMTPLATCVIPPLRTWREMPRSPDRNAN